MQRIILHIDMNSYFASVEQQANPHLRGRPVGVCEHLGGIIIAPSVEAKRLGIKLGMPVWEARKIFPQIVLLPVDPGKLWHVTAAFLRILTDYSDCVEKYSIDEAFVDITQTCGGKYEDALFLGLEIKQRLRLEVAEWVSASIGVGPNKLLAKIAADLGEGDIDRIFVVRPEDIPLLYERLNLTDIPGIGRRMERALNKLGILTLKELADYPVSNLINQFGLGGYFLHQMGNFDPPSSLIPPPPACPVGRQGERENFFDEEIKSIGHSYTLPKPTGEIKEIKKLMLKLSEKIGRRMRRKAARGNIVHYFHSGPLLHLPRTSGEKERGYFSRQHKIDEFINDGRDIYCAVWRIFEQDSPDRIKIMGVSISGLKFEKPQEPLFKEYKKPIWLVGAMDKINDKYGEFTIKRGRLMGIPREWGKDTVGFAKQ